jgi:hypothetical protein
MLEEFILIYNKVYGEKQSTASMPAEPQMEHRAVLKSIVALQIFFEFLFIAVT